MAAEEGSPETDRSLFAKAWAELWTDNGWWRRPAKAAPAKPAGDKSTTPSPKKETLSLSLGGATATVEGTCGCDGDSAHGGGDGSAGPKDEGGIGATVLKVAAWAATGLTATGFIVLVGAALFWIRFNELGLPATQAVGLLARNEMLTQGAQETALFLAIGLTVVLLLYFLDPRGTLPRVAVAMLALLVVAAIAYVAATHLSCLVKVALAAFALVLLAGTLVVALRTGSKFWPLALAVFVASLLFSALTGVLVVTQQSYVQPAAVLRGSSDAGMTGIYITASSDTLYLGQLRGIPVDDAKDPTKRAIFDVPLAGATYSVGPLESVPMAEAQAKVMLEKLIDDRERKGVASPSGGAAAGATSDSGSTRASSATVSGGATGTIGASGGGGEGSASGPGEPSLETVASAFGPRVSIHHTVESPWDCLVRYAAAGSPLRGRWWTSCAEDKKLEGMTILGIRDQLALPGRFQPAYDMRVEARLPEGAPLLYIEGEIGPQCEDAGSHPCRYQYEYPGGAAQIYLPKPQQAEDSKATCTSTRQDTVPVWGKCPS